MSVPIDQLERAIAAARVRQSQGYFTKVAAGDQLAASLFVRLVAYDLNPNGVASDFGWLSKSPGETQVDGYAEDAICYTANPGNFENVLDMVNGAGAPGASLPRLPDVKPRREGNRWVKPEALSPQQLAYLIEDAQLSTGGIPDYEALGGDGYWRKAIGVPLQEDMTTATVDHGGGPLNDGSSVWFARPIYLILHAYASGQIPDRPAIIKSIRNEWREVLRQQGATNLPPLT